VTVTAVHQLAFGVRKDSKRTGVDSLWNLKIPHQFQDISGALYVDGSGVLQSAIADLVPGGDVEHTVHASHGPAHRLLVSDVTFVESHVQRCEIGSLRRIANQCNHFVPSLGQLSGHLASDESGGTSQEIPHPYAPFIVVRRVARESAIGQGTIVEVLVLLKTDQTAKGRLDDLSQVIVLDAGFGACGQVF
jgi:hypothetical protein